MYWTNSSSISLRKEFNQFWKYSNKALSSAIKFTVGVIWQVINIALQMLRFLSLKPRLMRQIGPGHFEEVESRSYFIELKM